MPSIEETSGAVKVQNVIIQSVAQNYVFPQIVSANAGTRRPKVTWFLGCYVSRLLAFLAAWCLCFLGGRKGRQEGEERRSEEGISGKKQGRQARKEGNIAPRMEPLGGSKMHPKRLQQGGQKAPKSMPGGLWAAVGVPGALWGGQG